MGVTTYKDANGKTMVKGAPAGAWAIWVLAILVMIVNIPITLANPIVGIILFIIGSLFFFIGRKYTEVVRINVSRKAMEAIKKENELDKDKAEFEEFKKWKEQKDWR